MVHDDVAAKPPLADEHGDFIATALAGGTALFGAGAALHLTGLASGPAAIAAGSAGAAALGLAWLTSKTGALSAARLGALSLTSCFVGFAIATSGGASSPLIPLAALVPILAIGARSWSLSALSVALAGGAVWGGLRGADAALHQLSPVGAGVAVVLGAIAALVGMRLSGLTGRERAHDADIQRRADAVLVHTTELVTRHDRYGATLSASHAARELFGLPPTDLIGTGLLERVHLRDRVPFLHALSETGTTGHDHTVAVRIRAQTPGGPTWRRVDIACRCEQHADGDIEIVAVTRDASELHELREELAAARETIESDQASRNRFLGTMGHELRTPLNAIIGFSEMLEQGLYGSLPHKQHEEHARLIRESGQHLLQIVNDLLDASRLEAGHYELDLSSFAPAEIGRSTVEMLEPMAKAGGVTLNVAIADDLPLLTADRRACRQMLINLVSNAIKFTPEGGRVRVSALRHGRFLKFRVQDTGIGIPADALATLGTPFHQVHQGHARQYEGCGLGLSVVRGLVDLHDGTFHVASREGQGTTVSVTLPLARQDTRPVPARPQGEIISIEDAQQADRPASDDRTADAADTETPIKEEMRHARLSA